MSQGDDFDHDAYLRHMLRHAPDANASAPSALSDTILRQARQAADGAAAQRPAPKRRGATAVQPSLASSLWSWLMQPAVAGSFASLVVATLVGVMWWGQPIDETLREARAPELAVRSPAVPPSATAPTAPSATSAAAPELAAAPPPMQAPQEAAEERSQFKQDATRPDAAPAARPDNRLASGRPSPLPNGPPPALESKKRELADATRRDAAAVARVEARPPPAALQAAPPQAEPVEREAAAAPKAAALPASAPALARAAEAPAQSAVAAAAGAAATGAAAPGLVGRARLAADSATAATAPNSPLAGARAAVSAWPEVWTWQRGSSTEQPMTSAVQAWLGQADQAAGEGWQAAPSGAVSGRLQTLKLLRNGRLHTTVMLEAGALRVGTAQAPLPAATAAALSAALEQAAP